MSILGTGIVLAWFSVVAPPDWELFAPTGGDLRAVEHSPALSEGVLAGRRGTSTVSPGSVYRSLDGGASWTEILAHDGNDIEFASDGSAYVATSASLWRVTPDLASWMQLSLGSGTQHVLDVALDPGDPQALWIGQQRATSQTQTLRFSSDGGSTWQHRTPPARANTTCLAVAVDPSNSSRVFASFAGDTNSTGGGIWFSSDRGLTWSERTGSLPSRPILDIQFLGSRVWIAGGYLGNAFNPDGPFGLFESLDEGLTWTPLHDASWPSQVIQDIEADPHDLASIWLGTSAGVFRSIDAGQSWSFGVGGMEERTINQLSVSAHDSNRVLAATRDLSVWKSANAGVTFQPTSMPNAPLKYESISVHPQDPMQIAVVVELGATGGVLTTEDGGATWSMEPLPQGVYGLAEYSPTGELYALERLYPPSATAVHRRSAGVWAPVGSGPIPVLDGTGLRFDPDDPNLMLIAGFPGIWRSADGGSSWAQVYANFSFSSHVVGLDSSATPSGRVWFAGESGWDNSFHVGRFSRSVDGGQTWTLQGSGPMHMRMIVQSTFDPSALFAADPWFYGGGIWSSQDYGASWSTSAPTWPAEGVAVHPGSEIRIYGTTSADSLVSDDGGTSFSSHALPTNTPATDFEIAPDGSMLYFTSIHGAWRLSLDPVVPYCAAQPNSVGPGARLAWSGSTSISLNDLSIEASQLPATQPGLLFSGVGQIQLPFGNGMRCVGAGGLGLRRLGTKTSTALGTLEFAVDLAALQAAGLIAPGNSLNFQLQYRDTAAGGAQFNFSQALRAHFVP